MNGKDTAAIGGSKSNWPRWFEPRLPSTEECSLGGLLAARARHEPQRVFAALHDGSSWTHEQAFESSLATAGKLAALGVSAGDRVLVWLPNGPDILRYFFAASMLGAVIVPLNIGLRGSVLGHAVRTARAKVMAAHAGLLALLSEVETGELELVICVGELAGEQSLGTYRIALERDLGGTMSVADIRLNKPWDIAAILYSSGTTGPAKGVMLPFAQLWTLGSAFYGYVERDDRMLLILPLFHVAAVGALFGTMARDATFAIGGSFRASEFWALVRRTKSTTVPGFGRTFIDVLNKLPQRPDDHDNPLRLTVVQSVSVAVNAFRERYKCDVLPCYSMTETSCISISEINPEKTGSMGRPRSGVEVRIVDENDIEVPGEIAGELIVRADLPWVLNAGYYENPSATVQAWRNGWFHTGDIVRRDRDGDLVFVDRLKDVIRRRGENISSSEIENEACKHPAVAYAAALGVRIEEDEEVLLAVSLLPGQTLAEEKLLRFLIPRLPHFMVPRFIRIVDDLPRTQTNKVQKAELRKTSISDGAWDREAAGIEVARFRLRDGGQLI